MTELNSHTDAQLLAGVVAKDRRCFEELYLRYRRRVLGYLVRMLGGREHAEEVLDDTMLVVWTDAERFDNRSKVSTWIFGIAHNKAMKRRRRLVKHSAEVSTSREVLATRPDPARGMGPREIRWALDKALAALTPEHRAVVELTYFRDCSYLEVAEIVGCPVNTVKTRMFHARRRLREILPRLGLDSA